MNPRQRLQASYDRLAEDYARRISGELAGKPLDRQLLDRFADAVRDVGPACDIGCGPGHVARYLHERGVDVTGIDLAPGMLEQARRLTPGVAFRQGDMTALEAPDAAWAGIVAFYSLIHIPRDQIVATLGELKRVLRPRGLLLVAFHVGSETLHLDELWGHAIDADFLFFTPSEMTASLEEAGFAIDDVIEREPYPDVEHPSRRAYIFARS